MLIVCIVLLYWAFYLYPIVVPQALHFMTEHVLTNLYWLDLFSSWKINLSLSPGKHNTAVIIGAVVFLICGVLVYKRKKKLWLFCLVFWLPVALVYPARSYLFAFKPAAHTFYQLKVPQPTNYSSIFNKQKLLDFKPQNKLELYTAMEKLYATHAEKLGQDWKINEPHKLKTFFFINYLAHLWGYANLVKIKDPGCVDNNEQLAEPIAPENLTVQHFLKSNIACCKDYALVLKYLLSQAKIPNRLIDIQGWHLFNEVYFDDKWHVVDANTNIVIEKSWRELMQRKMGEQYNLILFPQPYLDNQSHPLFRPALKDFREEFIRWSNTRAFPNFQIQKTAKLNIP